MAESQPVALTNSHGKEATMLTLTRRIGESIIIETPAGEQMRVMVLGVDGIKVRLGIDASENVTVLREELVGRLQGDQGSG
jgi:carbon storage regulator